MTFGEYFHDTMTLLVKNHKWEDPYTAISPVHHDGRWLDMMLNGYNFGSTPEETAAVIHANSCPNLIHTIKVASHQFVEENLRSATDQEKILIQNAMLKAASLALEFAKKG